MRAALSLSMSRVVGQKASEPSLFESLLIGAPSLSTHPYILSKPALPPVLVLPQRACVCTILKPGVGVATAPGYERAGVLNEQQNSYYTLEERSRNGWRPHSMRCQKQRHLRADAGVAGTAGSLSAGGAGRRRDRFLYKHLDTSSGVVTAVSASRLQSAAEALSLTPTGHPSPVPGTFFTK
jgi:hypothetical protein